jgi:hypothetical protein
MVGFTEKRSSPLAGMDKKQSGGGKGGDTPSGKKLNKGENQTS